MEKCSNLRSVLTEKCIFARRNSIEKCKNNVVQKDKDVYRAAFEVHEDKILLIEGARQIGKSFFWTT